MSVAEAGIASGLRARRGVARARRASCRARASRVRLERPQPELFHGAGLYQPE